MLDAFVVHVLWRQVGLCHVVFLNLADGHLIPYGK